MRLNTFVVAVITASQLAHPVVAGNPVCHVPAVKKVVSHVAHVPHVQHAAPVYHAPQVQVIVAPVAVPVPVVSYEPIAKQGVEYYSYSKVTEPYSPIDYALVLEQLNRAVETQQAGAQTAIATFAAMADKARDRDAEIAKIRAAAESIERVVKEARTSSSTTIQSSTNFSINGGTVADAEAGGVELTNADAILSTRCASCHDNLRSWSKLSYDERKAALARIDHPDPSKRMPLAADRKSPGAPVPLEEKAVLFQSWKK